MPVRRPLLRLLGLLLVLCVTTFLILTWVASGRLICPARHPLQDYQREILDHANDHGLVIRRFAVATSDGRDTPCLLCEPSPQPGAAVKGNKLRQELMAQGVTIPPWGEVKATLVLLHGHNGRKEDHLAVAERFCAAGFRCILMDLPGHGEHPAKFASFGVNEARLPGEVLKAAAVRFGFPPQPAALFGISQGGAIALQAAACPGESWFAVAELSSFATLDDVIAVQAQQWFGPFRKPAHAMVRWLVQQRAGFQPEKVRPVDAASRLTTQAVLIGHGDSDSFILPEHAKRLFAAVPSPDKQFLTVPGAGHSNVLITPAPVYATVSAFFMNASVTRAPRTVTASPQR
jgi:pimeloyl-ACP methyl ester carboxylesterase